jgi:hypothetical protein
MNPVLPARGKGTLIKNVPSTTVQNLPPNVIVGDTQETKESLNKFIIDLYDITFLTPDDLKSIQNAFEYKGFNRDRVLRQLHALNNKRIVIELIIATALRGPQAAAKLKLSNNKTPPDMGIPASGQQGTDALTLNKIVSATADLAAYYLKRLSVAKRLQMDLPAWLQFPSAGSIILPKRYREQHLEFSRRFSTLIGGSFQEQIYGQMETNAYLDENLHLFDELPP